ncbi:hypothetical protein Ciccas_011955 [Cichlidogyrus casuarinus]|uniref:SOCS box domain-containing protein n=1 Tax=Cichlidogyrus casuarinus TaxID=1844966 RepID=A0ABD2PQA3_9PLAT
MSLRTSTNLLSESPLSYKEYVQNLFQGCACVSQDTEVLQDMDVKIARLIQKGDMHGVERHLKKMKRSQANNYAITVRRRHLSTAYPCLVDHRGAGTDPFINFYQECSLVIWAVDCLQWQMLPLLRFYGQEVNRPQSCRRWTYNCTPSSRPNTAPYLRFWTRGRYTYQSALDYFFASVYELVGEQPQSYHGLSGPSPLAFYFSHLPALLTKGLDVHKIDSVIVFNSLANSFDKYLCRYTNEHAIVPDIPEHDDAFVELTAVKRLIEHGFSQFECLEYLYPYCNWFGILICLVCHPKIASYSNILPPIIRQASLLLINFLVLRCAFPPPDDFKESIENLHLRKVYSKRYEEKRLEFNANLNELQTNCHDFIYSPLSLKLLARNKIRKLLGGQDFARKVASLGLPVHLSSFIQYINQEHMASVKSLKSLVKMATGEPVNGWPASDSLPSTVKYFSRSAKSRLRRQGGNMSSKSFLSSICTKMKSVVNAGSSSSIVQGVEIERHADLHARNEGDQSEEIVNTKDMVLNALNSPEGEDPTRPYLLEIWQRQMFLRSGRGSERQRPKNIPLWPLVDEFDFSNRVLQTDQLDEDEMRPQRPRSAPIPKLKVDAVCINQGVASNRNFKFH